MGVTKVNDTDCEAQQSRVMGKLLPDFVFNSQFVRVTLDTPGRIKREIVCERERERV